MYRTAEKSNSDRNDELQHRAISKALRELRYRELQSKLEQLGLN